MENVEYQIGDRVRINWDHILITCDKNPFDSQMKDKINEKEKDYIYTVTAINGTQYPIRLNGMSFDMSVKEIEKVDM